jgi:hypothetical protein
MQIMPDPGSSDDIVRAYEESHHRYSSFTNVLHGPITSLVVDAGITVHSIQSRTKISGV